MRDDLTVVPVVVGFALAFVLPTILWAAMRDCAAVQLAAVPTNGPGDPLDTRPDRTLEQTAYDATIFTRADLGIAVLVEEATNELIVTASWRRPRGLALAAPPKSR
jgi:hypothetical protein